MRGEVRDGSDSGVRLLREATEECAHGEAAVLELLDLHLLHVDLLGELEGVEAAAGVDADVGGRGEALGGRGNAAAVGLGEAEEDHLEGEHGPEGGEARALGGEGRDGAGEVVVLEAGGRGAQRAGLVPGHSGGLLLRHDAGDGEHRPPAVDNLVLGRLLHGEDVVVAERGGLVRVGGAGVRSGLRPHVGLHLDGAAARDGLTAHGGDGDLGEGSGHGHGGHVELSRVS
mmetsp:Transcript_130803/g.317718  ORF Transcript_130803/g.317718 Transcript_130803/m.317718 type:complete len:229 (+) Transcript_130803:171-857(+)